MWWLMLLAAMQFGTLLPIYKADFDLDGKKDQLYMQIQLSPGVSLQELQEETPRTKACDVSLVVKVKGKLLLAGTLKRAVTIQLTHERLAFGHRTKQLLSRAIVMLVTFADGHEAYYEVGILPKKAYLKLIPNVPPKGK